MIRAVQALAVGISLISGCSERANVECDQGDSFERAVCILEEGGDERAGMSAVASLAAQGDRRAMSFYAGWYRQQGTADEQRLASVYARQLAFEGNFVWSRQLILDAIDRRDAGPIQSLRCALVPSLTRQDIVRAARELHDYPEPTPQSKLATILARSFERQVRPPPDETLDEDWQRVAVQFNQTAPWLDVDMVLLSTCAAE